MARFAALGCDLRALPSKHSTEPLSSGEAGMSTKVFWAAFVFLAASGPCVAQEAASPLAGLDAQCKSSIPSDVKASLAGKVPILHTSEIVPSMFADSARPTAKEASALLQLADAEASCRQLMVNELKRQSATMGHALEEFVHRDDIVTADLASGKLTFGEANRLYYDAYASADQQLGAAIQREEAERRVQRAAERQERSAEEQRTSEASAAERQKAEERRRLALQEFAAGLRDFGQQIQRNAAASETAPPSHTDCRWVGSTWSCTTF